MSERKSRWLKHYPPEIPATLDYPDEILPFFLEEAASVKPAHIAVRFMGKSISYLEIYEQALSLANSLRQLGLQQGDRVALMLPNCPQAVIGYYGILLAGGIVVQTNPLYVERELEYQLNDSGAEMIIALDLVYPKIARVQSSTGLKQIIITSIKDYLPFPKSFLYPYVQKKQGVKVDIQYGGQLHSFTRLIKQHQALTLTSGRTPDDIAVLQYTGGTTGQPKGVILSHRNLVVNAFQCQQWLSQTDYGTDKSLGIVPFFHVYGMTVVMNMSILTAATMILVPKFEPRDVLKVIEKEKPTLFPGAPTMYIALLNHPDLKQYDLSSIKVCISGSAPLPVEVQQRFEAVTNGKIVEGYGLTETSPVTHANLIWGKNVIGSIGIPWPDTEATIVSLDTREELLPGEIGEVAIKGPQVMEGYWKNEQATAEVFRDGWFLTGDLGYMDTEGYFYIVDRKKDLIIAGGYNIYPREVEEVLYEHSAVKECSVVGIPDTYRGETVKAYIVPKKDTQVTEAELERFCRERLAAYKIPRIYEFRAELPKSMIGKILKRVLMDEYKAATPKEHADSIAHADSEEDAVAKKDTTSNEDTESKE